MFIKNPEIKLKGNKWENFIINYYIWIKIIYILWFQGFENSPEVVKQCVKSWKYYNPDWNIILLDNTNLSNYVRIDDYLYISGNQIEKCHLADIIRCILLNNYGGLWTDATTFCNKPLNDWLPHYITEGFFAFNKPTTIPDKILSNYFLYADKKNYIIEKWCFTTIDFHKTHELNYPYFIHHFLFEDLYNEDNDFNKIWDKVPKFPASGIGPHYLEEKGFFEKINEEIKKDIDDKITPLYKLTYKIDFPIYDENKNIYYVYSTIKWNEGVDMFGQHCDY